MADPRLAFLIWGVARSGTTALRLAVNLHPAIFCTHEWLLAWNPKPELLKLPETLLAPAGTVAELHVRQRDQVELRERLQRQPPSIYGDKLPDYYLQPDLIRANYPAIKHIVIYRGPYNFTQSWDARAADPGDAWSVHQTGLVALYEWLMCLDTIASYPENLHIFSWEALFQKDPAHFAEVLRILTGETPDTGIVEAYRRKEFRRRAPDAAKRSLCAYRPLLRRVGADDLDKLINDLGYTTGAAVAPKLQAYVDAAAPLVARHLRGHYRAAENRQSLPWAQGWFQRRLILYNKNRHIKSAPILDGLEGIHGLVKKMSPV